MASADAILSSQAASECFKINKYVASPVIQVQKQSDGSTASGSRRQLKEEMNNAAVSVKIVNKQKLKPRFAVELDGLNCFETLVPR